MIQSHTGENGCRQYEGYLPGHVYIGSPGLEVAGKGDQDALSEYRGQTVKCAPDADELRLLVGIESQHIESVSCDIMCG